MLKGKRILLIVTGGIAAFKSLELVRQIRTAGGEVRAILTKSATEFVTPLSLQALTEDRVYSDIFSLCLLYTSPSPRDSCASRMPSSA